MTPRRVQAEGVAREVYERSQGILDAAGEHQLAWGELGPLLRGVLVEQAEAYMKVIEELAT